MPVTKVSAKLSRYLWASLIAVLVLVATYVSIGRMVMPRLGDYQQSIEATLSERLGMRVSAQSLQGGWQGFQPTIKLTGVSLAPDPGAEQALNPALNIERIEMRLDALASLLSKKVIFSSLVLEGTQLELAQDGHGHWHVEGMPASGKKANPLDWLLLQEQLLVKQLKINLKPNKAEAKALEIPQWVLKCGSQVCSSQGSLRPKGLVNGPLQFAVNSYGRPGNQNFQMRGYFSAPPVQLVDWFFLVNKLPMQAQQIDSLMLGGELWFEWANEQLLDVRGRVELPEVRLGESSGDFAAFESLQSNFFWQRGRPEQGEDWRLSLDEFTFEWGEQRFEPAQRRIVMRQTEQGKVAHVWADRVALQPLTQALMATNSLPEKIRDVLAVLRPSGELQNAHFDYPLDTGVKIPDFNFRARMANVAAAAWKGTPTLVGVNGYLKVGPGGGEVDFDTENLAMQFPKVFSDIWLFKNARGVVSWRLEDSVFWLNGRNLQLSGPVGDVAGQFSFVSSKGQLEPRLGLLIGLENAHLPDAMTFVPDVVIHPKLGNWLAQAFSAGKVQRVRFVLDQAVTKGAPPVARSLAMAVDATQVDFSYHPDWPQLTQANVGVKIIDRNVSVAAPQARFFDLELKNLIANYTSDARGAGRLQAEAEVKGPLKDSWRALTDTPLQKTVFQLAKDFQFTGQMQGNLALDLPFSDLRKSHVELDFSSYNASLSIPSLSIAAESISGAFNYTSRKGLTAKSVEASMFGFPLAMAIGSKKSGTGYITEFDFQGRVKAMSLSPWVPGVVLSKLSGETDFEALLKLGSEVNSELTVESDLQGLKVNLPEPFTKQVTDTIPLRFNLSLTGPQIHTLRYGDKFGYSLRFQGHTYQDGVIRLGPGQLAYQPSTAINVFGSLPELDLSSWQKLMNGDLGSHREARSGIKNTSVFSNISHVTVDVEQLHFLDEQYDNTHINAKQVAGDWHIGFNNELAKGRLSYYPVTAKPLAVDFDYLYLPAKDTAQKSDEARGKRDALADWVPQQLPELDLQIKRLVLGEEPYGRWAFNSRPQLNGIKLEGLNFEFKGIQGAGEIDWVYENKAHRTEFRGDVKIPNVARALKALQLTAAVEAKNTRFSGHLNWPGTPSAFSLIEGEGMLAMSSKEGRLIDLKALPLLGVFNFNNLSRRLRLDFSDLFEKGFSFDKAKGRFEFEDGLMQLTEPLVIEGPSAKFKVEGTTDLRRELFNHDVIAVLPVTDSIPVLVTLAGFPQIGIPVYLFNRSFGDMFDRFTSVNYKVTGSWRDPEIKLTSFFKSDDLKKQQRDKPVRRPKR